MREGEIGRDIDRGKYKEMKRDRERDRDREREGETRSVCL